MYQSTVLQWAQIQSISSTTFTGSYQLLGTISNEPRILRITNGSNVAITISQNGTTDMDVVLAGATLQLDLGEQRGNPSPATSIQSRTAIYVKGSAGTGNVYLAYLYASTPSQTLPL